MIVQAPPPVDLLILGAGWSSSFLIPLLQRHHISYAATTRDGRGDTTKFTFDPSNPNDDASFFRLPAAATVLITFPLKGVEQAGLIVELYRRTHPDGPPAAAAFSGEPRSHFHFVLLGATSIWTAPTWSDSSSPYDTSGPRAQAEDALLASDLVVATVLDLAGLYGAQRQPRNWVDRVVKTKEDLKGKGALHLVHGDDVAGAIVGVHKRWVKGDEAATGRRWLVCDLRVYDWWDLVADWTAEDLRIMEGKKLEEKEDRLVERATRLRGWVGELMLEEGVRALPRDTERLGRVLDGRSFWEAIGMWPARGRMR